MTIGGGVRFRDMVDPLFAAGFQIRKLFRHLMLIIFLCLTPRKKPEHAPVLGWLE